MPVSYDDIFALRYQEQWLQQRTEVSVVKVANYIQYESPETPDHENRIAWARWAVKNSMVAVNSFRWAVAFDPTVAAQRRAINDDQLDAIVSAALPAAVADFVAGGGGETVAAGGPMAMAAFGGGPPPGVRHLPS